MISYTEPLIYTEPSIYACTTSPARGLFLFCFSPLFLPVNTATSTCYPGLLLLGDEWPSIIVIYLRL
jgi:hypothetical protein